jgi:aryl-alcohol dehydrogenase-like predicted oxidoreductase
LLNKLGFGTWGIGGESGKFGSYGGTDDSISKSALLHAYNKGIRFFDTAPPYGDGHAEELLGSVFEDEIFSDVKILTKVGVNSWNDEVNFTSSFITESIQNSLSRLKRKSVFAVILHSLKSELKNGSVEEGYSTLSKLKKQGLIENIGFSCKSPSELPRIFELYPDTNIIEANYHLLDMRIHENSTQNCLRQNKPIFIARTPLCFGFLTDKISKDTVFDELDHRSRWKKKQIDYWVDGRVKLEEIFKRYGFDEQIQVLALSFCLQNSLVDLVIPGMMNQDEVNSCLHSLEVKSFSNDLLKEIEGFNIQFNNSLVI